MRMQWRSRGSPASSPAPTMLASFWMSLTLTMSMSFSQQKAWMRVKWIWRAMSPSSSSSAASRQKATVSGSLQKETPAISPLPRSHCQGVPALRLLPSAPPWKALQCPGQILTHSSAWPTRRLPPSGSRAAARRRATRGGLCRRFAYCCRSWRCCCC